MERNDWKKHVQLKEKNDYTVAAQPMVDLSKFVNPEMMGSAAAVTMPA